MNSEDVWKPSTASFLSTLSYRSVGIVKEMQSVEHYKQTCLQDSSYSSSRVCQNLSTKASPDHNTFSSFLARFGIAPSALGASDNCSWQSNNTGKEVSADTVF